MATYQKISADEAQAKRNDHLRKSGNGIGLAKAMKAPPSWDKTARTARFVMTSQSVDRYGDIIVTAGIDTTQFELNPVGLMFHSSRTWPVAKWGNVEKILKGRPPRMEGDFMMLPGGGPVPEVDQAAWMIENGGISACSIGFVPNWDDVEMILDDDGMPTWGFRFNTSELVECSICSVPANADALVKSAHGDMDLARELLEDVLDNWVRSPEGLLLSRTDFEKTYRTTVEKIGLVSNDAPGGILIEAVATAVTEVDPIVADGSHTAGSIEAKDITVIELAAIDANLGKAQEVTGVIKAAPAAAERATVELSVDTAEATAKLTAFERLVDGVMSKVAKLFGAAEKTTIEPPPALPTEEETKAVLDRATAARARMVERGIAV